MRQEIFIYSIPLSDTVITDSGIFFPSTYSFFNISLTSPPSGVYLTAFEKQIKDYFLKIDFIP